MDKNNGKIKLVRKTKVVDGELMNLVSQRLVGRLGEDLISLNGYNIFYAVALDEVLICSPASEVEASLDVDCFQVVVKGDKGGDSIWTLSEMISSRKLVELKNKVEKFKESHPEVKQIQAHRRMRDKINAEKSDDETGLQYQREYQKKLYDTNADIKAYRSAFYKKYYQKHKDDILAMQKAKRLN